MTDRSPLHSDEQALEASTSYSDDGSLGEGKYRHSHDDTYSEDYASQVKRSHHTTRYERRISCGTYQVEAASAGRISFIRCIHPRTYSRLSQNLTGGSKRQTRSPWFGQGLVSHLLFAAA